MDHEKARLRVQDRLMGIMATPVGLTESTLRNLLHAFAALSEPIDLPQFPIHAMNAARCIFASDLCSYGEIDTEMMHAASVHDFADANVGSLVDAWARHVLEEPILSYWRWLQPGFAVTLSDFGTPARIRELDIYANYLHPVGIEHHLLMPFMRTSNRILSVGYGRTKHDFSEDDRLALILLRPQLTLCRRHSEIRSITRAAEPFLHTDLSVTRIEVIVVGRDARVHSASSRAVELIHAHVGAFPRHSTRLPGRLEAHVLSASSPTPGLRAPRDFAELSVFTMNDGDAISLYLCHRRPLPIELLMEAIGTTRRRQTEVARGLCRDATRPDIARELGMSVRTVDKHIENLFRDLGLQRQVDAVAEIRRRLTEFLRQHLD